MQIRDVRAQVAALSWSETVLADVKAANQNGSCPLPACWDTLESWADRIDLLRNVQIDTGLFDARDRLGDFAVHCVLPAVHLWLRTTDPSDSTCGSIGDWLDLVNQVFAAGSWKPFGGSGGQYDYNGDRWLVVDSLIDANQSGDTSRASALETLRPRSGYGYTFMHVLRAHAQNPDWTQPDLEQVLVATVRPDSAAPSVKQLIPTLGDYDHMGHELWLRLRWWWIVGHRASPEHPWRVTRPLADGFHDTFEDMIFDRASVYQAAEEALFDNVVLDVVDRETFRDLTDLLIAIRPEFADSHLPWDRPG